jgi:hypothetical protein
MRAARGPHALVSVMCQMIPISTAPVAIFSGERAGHGARSRLRRNDVVTRCERRLEHNRSAGGGEGAQVICDRGAGPQHIDITWMTHSRRCAPGSSLRCALNVGLPTYDLKTRDSPGAGSFPCLPLHAARSRHHRASCCPRRMPSPRPGGATSSCGMSLTARSPVRPKRLSLHLGRDSSCHFLHHQQDGWMQASGPARDSGSGSEWGL